MEDPVREKHGDFGTRPDAVRPCLTGGRRHGDHHVPKNIARTLSRFALPHGKSKHVRRPIPLAVVTVEGVDFSVAAQHHREFGPGEPETPEHGFGCADNLGLRHHPRRRALSDHLDDHPRHGATARGFCGIPLRSSDGRAMVETMRRMRFARLVAIGGFLAWPSHVLAQTPDAALASPRPLPRCTVSIFVGAGEHRGRGVVLETGGRIVTPLAGVRDARDIRVRYPDGRTERARLVAMDTGWGIALLEPAAGRWPEGAPLPVTEPAAGAAVTWQPREGSPAESSGTLRHRRTFAGPDGAILRDAWEISPLPSHTAAGCPVLDALGNIVALVVAPAVGSGADGAPWPFGVPASVLRGLLASAVGPNQPWLGLDARDLHPGEESTTTASAGVRVIDVRPGSPAQAAGLRAGALGDVIVGVDGRPVRNNADFAALLAQQRSGDQIVLQVLRAGVMVNLPVHLNTLTAPTVAVEPHADAPTVTPE